MPVDARTLLQYLQGDQYLPLQAEQARQARIGRVTQVAQPAPPKTFGGFPGPEYGMPDVRLPLADRNALTYSGSPVPYPFTLLPSHVNQAVQDISSVGQKVDRGFRSIPEALGFSERGGGGGYQFPAEDEYGMSDARLPLSQRNLEGEGEGQDTGEVPPFDAAYQGADFFGLAPEAGTISSTEAHTQAAAQAPVETEPVDFNDQMAQVFGPDTLSPELGLTIAANPEVAVEMLVERGIEPPPIRAVGAASGDSPEGRPKSGGTSSPLTSALSAVQAPERPQLQRISSPSAPRPAAIQRGTVIAQLLNQLAGDTTPAGNLRLQQTVGRRYNG